MNIRIRLLLAFALAFAVLGTYSALISQSGPAPDPLLVQGAANLHLPIDRVSITRWRPDTCDCDVYYAWDKSSSEDARVHIPIRAQSCRFHKGATPGAVFDSVIAENRHKNVSVGAAALALNMKPEDIVWELDGERQLSLILPRDRALAASALNIPGVRIAFAPPAGVLAKR